MIYLPAPDPIELVTATIKIARIILQCVIGPVWHTAGVNCTVSEPSSTVPIVFIMTLRCRNTPRLCILGRDYRCQG